VIPLRDANPVRRAPVVTIGLIIACVAVFAYELGSQSTGGDPALEALFRQYGLVPADLTAALGGGQTDRAFREVLTIDSAGSGSWSSTSSAGSRQPSPRS